MQISIESQIMEVGFQIPTWLALSDWNEIISHDVGHVNILCDEFAAEIEKGKFKSVQTRLALIHCLPKMDVL